MIQLIIKLDKSYLININPYESVYSLKEKINEKVGIKIEKQILNYSGKILNDNISLKEYQIIDNSEINVSISMKGGNFDVFTILIWIFYIVIVLLYLLVLISGTIPVLAHLFLDTTVNLFETAGNWIHGAIGTPFKIGAKGKEIYELVKWALMLIVRIGIVYFFVYALSALIIFPLVYWKDNNTCKSLNAANKTGYAMALAFIIVYGLFNVPDEILSMARAMEKKSVYTDVILSPFLGLIKDFADVGKFSFLYAIPIVGTPILDGYHFAISVFSGLLYDGVNTLKEYSCDNKNEMAEIGRLVDNWRDNSVLENYVKSYNAGELMRVLTIGLTPKTFEKYECEVGNMPFWSRWSPFDKTASEYYMAKYSTQGFCAALRLIRAFSKELDGLGGSEQIANMIKTGSMGGMAAFIAFIVSLLLILFNVW